MRLYLIRHPRTVAPAGVCYGSTDMAVTPEDNDACLRRLLASAVLPPGLPVYSSPLRRCEQLARRLAASWGVAPPELDPRLAEMDFGAWEQRRWAGIPRPEIDAWAADMAGYRPGGGENVLAMAARVRAFRADVTARGRDACVVCHAGTIRLLVAMHGRRTLEAVAEAAARATVRIGYGQLVVLPAGDDTMEVSLQMSTSGASGEAPSLAAHRHRICP